ncbi:hypothetical protein N431DRAFT_492017 [Stipitochalara longipes BDJ]|nr:hypothetical protein N431DRAFT_492017 [Stipitochalara longipes BDJ]
MSTPANDGPSEKKEKGVNKLLTRMKTVLKRSDGSKRLSFSGKSKSVSGPSEPKPEPVAAAEPAAQAPDGGKKVMRSEIEAERNKKLAERFAITIEPLSTKADKEVHRIEKPVRMRIHRICHKCNTTYGGSKVCIGCGHARCTKCPRFPVKKPEGKGKATEAAAPKGDIIEADSWFGLKEEVPLTMPNPKPNGQPLVRKAPRQRVRRTCCKCETLYATGSKTCANCEHGRCTDCPRDPAKKKKFPDGYPGDAYSDDITKPVKYSCHKCGKIFPPVPHPDSEEGKAVADAAPPECVRCHHPKCESCPRAAPAKVEPAPDPAVLASVKAKLAALDV